MQLKLFVRWAGFTPGPWEVELIESDAGGHYITGRILGPSVPMFGGQREQIVGRSALGDGVQRQVDAHFIAAAPIMFNALLEAEAALEFAIAKLGESWENTAERVGLRIVQDAIRKARGIPTASLTPKSEPRNER